jgi:DNA uptake protein ComE-like DNA-binding protein
MKPIHLLLWLLGLALAPAGWGAKPEAAEKARPAGATPASGAASATVKPKPAPVDINTTTDPAKLRALDNELTAARAQAIIDGRPYGNIDELVGQKILPQKLFDRIKRHLTASKAAKP